MNITPLPRLASVWHIAPLLTVTEAELDEGLAILDRALREGLAGR
jgi:2,2-dialkylglycine decarboxylase (pyruvate)